MNNQINISGMRGQVKKEAAFLKTRAMRHTGGAKTFASFDAGMSGRQRSRLKEVFFGRAASLLFLQKKNCFL
jgi:hypothetical protein